MFTAAGLMVCLLVLSLGIDHAMSRAETPSVADGYRLAQARVVPRTGRIGGGLGSGMPTAPSLTPIVPLNPPTLSTPLPPPTAVAPPAVVIPPKTPRCRRHPCASQQAYKVKKCNTCREEWKFRCVAGLVCQ